MGRQIPEADKGARADFVVDTSGEISASRAQLDEILVALKGREATAFARSWT